MLSIEVKKLLDKNGNPSRKRKEKLLSEQDKEFLRSIHEEINVSLYCVHHNITPPYCFCGKPCSFRNFQVGFGRCCSVSCSSLLGQDAIRNKYKSMTKEERNSIQEKRTKTTIEKYGVSHVLQNPNIVSKLKRTRKEKDYIASLETFKKKFKTEGNIEDIEFWKQECEKFSSVRQMADSNDLYFSDLYRWWDKIGFSSPFPRSSSGAQREINQFIISLGVETLFCDRNTLNGKEIDILIPSKNIGIEFDGLYWHRNSSSREKQKLAANIAGIDLICIFEDEWEHKQEIVKSIIKSKLNIYEKKLFARKTTKKQVEYTEAKKFLESNHIAGHANCKTYIGLYYDNELVCLAGIGKSRFTKEKLELIRFCSKLNHQVVGGLTKLLSGYQLESYADRRYSPSKSSYGLIGELVGETGNGYYWVWKGKRINRFQTQKHKLKNLLPKFDPNKTENENMEEHGAYKIYDCGNWKYEINL